MRDTLIGLGVLAILATSFVTGAIIEKTRPGAIPFIGDGRPSPFPILKTGIYSVRGYNSADASESDAPSYIGNIVIDRVGDSYNLEWRLGSGQTQKGVGILTGDVLSVSYIDVTVPDDISDAGVVSYRLLDEDSLYGAWASFLLRESGREYLRWQKD